MFFKRIFRLPVACDIGTSTEQIFHDKKSFTWHPLSYAIRFNLEWSTTLNTIHNLWILSMYLDEYIYIYIKFKIVVFSMFNKWEMQQKNVSLVYIYIYIYIYIWFIYIYYICIHVYI